MWIVLTAAEMQPSQCIIGRVDVK